MSSTVIVLMLAAPFTSLSGSIDDFDVAGMTLGMSVAEVEKAAAQRGLAVDHRSPGPSFAQRVAIAQGDTVTGKDYEAVRGLLLVSESEEVQVKFVPTHEGERAYYIKHLLLDRSLKPDSVGTRIEKQYGEPDIKRDKEWVWGDTAYYALDRKAPYLEFIMRPTSRSKSMKRAVVKFTLTDPALPKQIKAAIDAES